MQIFIGQNEIGGEFSRYAARFQVLEVASDAGKLPKLSRLKAWRDEAPSGFVFSVLLPQSVAALDDSPKVQADLERALEAASCLGASWIVLGTPTSVRPSARSEAKIKELVAKVREQSKRSDGSVPQIAWQPAGLWDAERSEQLAKQLGIAVVRDLCREDAPAGDALYTRIRTLGTSSRIGPGLVQKLIERSLGATSCFIVVEGRSGEHLQRLIKEELVLLADSDGLDEELEDEGELAGSEGDEDADGASEESDEDGDETTEDTASTSDDDGFDEEDREGDEDYEDEDLDNEDSDEDDDEDDDDDDDEESR